MAHNLRPVYTIFLSFTQVNRFEIATKSNEYIAHHNNTSETKMRTELTEGTTTTEQNRTKKYCSNIEERAEHTAVA